MFFSVIINQIFKNLKGEEFKISKEKKIAQRVNFV